MLKICPNPYIRNELFYKLKKYVGKEFSPEDWKNTVEESCYQVYLPRIDNLPDREKKIMYQLSSPCSSLDYSSLALELDKQ